MTTMITENHPFMKKVNKLYTIMEELGISIEYGGVGGLNIVDEESKKYYRLKDNDTSAYSPIFPTGVEFKLTFEK